MTAQDTTLSPGVSPLVHPGAADVHIDTPTTSDPGSAPAIVFVHGVRSSAAIWDNQLAHVRALGYDAVAVDLPAHGSRWRQKFSIAEAFRVFDEAAASFGPNRRVVIVGLSLGGYLSLAWAAQRPSNLVGVVASACTSDPKGKPVGLFRDTMRAVVTGRDVLVRAYRRSRDMVMAGLFPRKVLPGQLTMDGSGVWTRSADPVPDGLRVANAIDDPPPARLPWSIVTDVLNEVSGHSWLAYARQITAPMWLINGSHDHMRLDERRYVRATGARLVVVPKAGHDVNVDAPQAFNRALDAALSAFTFSEGTPAATPVA